MKLNTFWITELLVVATAAQAALGQISRDALQIGDRWYLRSHRNISPFGFDQSLDMSMHDGVIAVSGWLEVPEAQEQLGVQHFDRWLLPRHDPIWVDPVHAERAVAHSAASHSGRTITYWGERNATGSNWIRTMSSDGELLAPSTFVVNMLNAPRRLVGISSSHVLTLINVQEIYMRWYTIDLQPIGNLTEFVGRMGGYNRVSTLDIAQDASYAVVTYTNYFNNGLDTRVFYQVIYPDHTFDEPVKLAPDHACCGRIRILEYGELAVEYSTNPTGTMFLQRRLLNGTIIDSTEVAGIYNDVRFADTGECVVLTKPDNVTLRLQLFDANWIALGPPFDFSENAGAAPLRTNDDIRKRVGIDNGTVVVFWGAYGGAGAGWYLTSLVPFLPGDMNRDGLVNNFDIDPFVFALSNLPAYAATYNIPEDAAVIIGDINEDGTLNNFDIDPFVMLLAGE